PNFPATFSAFNMNTASLHTTSFLKHLLMVLAIAIVMYYGRVLLIPMSYGLLIAIVLYPICRWMEKRGWPRSLAIAAGLLIVVVLFAALVGLLVIQVNIFYNDLPGFLTSLKPSLLQLQQWAESKLGIAVPAQQEWWQKTIHNAGNNTGAIIRNTVSTTTALFFTLFLVPVFAALFLYNRGSFVRFLMAIAGPGHSGPLKDILAKVIHTYFNFIKGMLMVYLIVGSLNSIGLLALGIPHAILFGMLTAIMTIIPYVGIFISALLPVTLAWVTKGSIWYPLGVVGVFTFVQYLEANIIFPRVVGTQLKISTWATLVAIISGGLLWGVSGMILFIPFAGILKIVFDYIPALQFYNILLGRDEPGNA
ncbi:MAG TPA: AI-2E family transporter, partial [Chitinophagaceae bacterium]|nr:AI-2E family transporter [Chitinophagaceae bacterium]